MFLVIIWIAKLTGGLSRLFGRGGGSALPGLLAEQSDSQILSQLGERLKGGSIVITGTNGKTTTTKMVQEILESVGYKVITNRSGSNLSRGIVSTLIERIGWNGTIKEDFGLFEVDEASMPAVCAALKPKAVLVLNLFRDQLDRYGELDTTAALIGQAVEPLDTQLYLNADDPLVASLRRYAPGKVHYFGVEEAKLNKLEHDLAADSDHCPHDGALLKYHQNFFGHIGHYVCPRGDFERPKPETVINSYKSGEAFTVEAQGQTSKLYLPLPGLYNAYNALAAISLCVGLGITVARSTLALERVTAAFGRVERLEIDGRTVYLLLIKNPTGFNQVIQTFLTGNKAHSVMVAINDNFADGRDVSWLWDVAFEEMAGRGHKIIASGVRAEDLALRLKYAEEGVLVEDHLEVALNQAVAAAAVGETVYILPTYTAMLEIRDRIRTHGLVEGRWA